MWTCKSCAEKFKPVTGSRKCDSCRRVPMTHEEAIAHGREKAKAWYHSNKERKREYDRARREAKPELYREASKRNRQAHPDKKNASTNARRKRVQQATPVWSNLGRIREIYLEASRLSKELGIEMHVDHVVPLKGKLVCGLHVPENLKIMVATDNMSKSNHFSIEHEGKK